MDRPVGIPAPGPSIPSMAWTMPGAKLKGALARHVQRQDTEFGTSKPAFWPSGDPKLVDVVTLVTVACNDRAVDSEGVGFEPGDLVRVFVQSSGDLKAWRKALREYCDNDHESVEIGDMVCVHYVGEERGDGFTRKAKEFSFAESGDDDDYVAEAVAFFRREQNRSRPVGVAPDSFGSEPFETVNTEDEGGHEPF